MLMHLSKNLNQMLLNLPKRDFGRFETRPFQIIEISSDWALRRLCINTKWDYVEIL